MINFILLGLMGCASTQRVPALSLAEQAQIEGIRFPLTIGVDTYEDPIYSRSLVRSLRRTELFGRVDHLRKFSSPPDLIAQVEEAYTGLEGGPSFLWLFSLGIIPQLVDQRIGEVFSLRRPSSPEEKIRINFRWRTSTVVGYLGAPLALHPDWFNPIPLLPPGPDFLLEVPTSDERFFQRLALEIVPHFEKLEAWVREIQGSQTETVNAEIQDPES